MKPNRLLFQSITNKHPEGSLVTAEAHLPGGVGNLVVYTCPANITFLPTFFSFSIHGNASNWGSLEIWNVVPAKRDCITMIDIRSGNQGTANSNIHDQLWLVPGETIRLYSNHANIHVACCIRGYEYSNT